MDTAESDTPFRRTKIVLEILLEQYYQISHEQIRNELVTILIGIHVRYLFYSTSVILFLKCNKIDMYSFTSAILGAIILLTPLLSLF